MSTALLIQVSLLLSEEHWPHQPSELQTVTAPPQPYLPLVPQGQELHHKIPRKPLSALAVLTQTLPEATLLP